MLVVARGREVWESKRLKGTKSHEHRLSILKQVSHRGVTHSLGNIINNTVVTVYGDRWEVNLTMEVILQFTEILQRYCRLAPRPPQ